MTLDRTDGLNESILAAGFRAALRWMYSNVAEEVRKSNIRVEDTYDGRYLNDLADMRQAYAVLLQIDDAEKRATASSDTSSDQP